MCFETQQRPLLERELVGVLREYFDLEAQLAAELGFVGKVDVEVRVVDRCSKLSPLVIVAGREVARQLLEFVVALLRGDEVNIETDLAADAYECCPPADQDRGFKVVTEPVNERTDDSVVVLSLIHI